VNIGKGYTAVPNIDIQALGYVPVEKAKISAYLKSDGSVDIQLMNTNDYANTIVGTPGYPAYSSGKGYKINSTKTHGSIPVGLDGNVKPTKVKVLVNQDEDKNIIINIPSTWIEYYNR